MYTLQVQSAFLKCPFIEQTFFQIHPQTLSGPIITFYFSKRSQNQRIAPFINLRLGWESTKVYELTKS
jgi:hypothetical protein